MNSVCVVDSNGCMVLVVNVSDRVAYNLNGHLVAATEASFSVYAGCPNQYRIWANTEDGSHFFGVGAPLDRAQKWVEDFCVSAKLIPAGGKMLIGDEAQSFITSEFGV